MGERISAAIKAALHAGDQAMNGAGAALANGSAVAGVGANGALVDGADLTGEATAETPHGAAIVGARPDAATEDAAGRPNLNGGAKPAPSAPPSALTDPESAATRLAMLRLINAAVEERVASHRGRRDADEDAEDAGANPALEAEIRELLATMVRQREASAQSYEESGRLELAERERQEVRVIQEFLPKQMSADETSRAVDALVDDLGASGLRDVGRVMAALKSTYAGRMDFSVVSDYVKQALCSRDRAAKAANGEAR